VHTLDVALLNVHARNPEHAALRAWVDGTGADVVVLVEVTPGLVHALEGAYPHAVVVPHDDDEFGVGVWSRFPLGQVVEERPHGYVSTVQLTVDADGAPLRLGVLHAPPPLSPGLVSERADVLAGVAGGLRAHGGPSVLLGDLNLTPWSPHLRHLRVVARLEDGAAGFGPAPTWPAFAGPLGIPIDHVLVSPEVAVLGYTTATAPGSDHRAVLARLSW
ncbi:MAG: endonuclease/exonuclease/phosphatase family protein, partial [Myxococcales bacterium]|nr:endonuclease/exonuclease/phosphatase family protein [Myxococcales bacterium]